MRAEDRQLQDSLLSGDLPGVRKALAEGADPDLEIPQRGRPLHMCLDHPGIVSVLLAAGADPNAPGFYGESPLVALVADTVCLETRGECALTEYLCQSAEQLLRAGADPGSTCPLFAGLPTAREAFPVLVAGLDAHRLNQQLPKARGGTRPRI